MRYLAERTVSYLKFSEYPDLCDGGRNCLEEIQKLRDDQLTFSGSKYDKTDEGYATSLSSFLEHYCKSTDGSCTMRMAEDGVGVPLILEHQFRRSVFLIVEQASF